MHLAYRKVLTFTMPFLTRRAMTEGRQGDNKTNSSPVTLFPGLKWSLDQSTDTGRWFGGQRRWWNQTQRERITAGCDLRAWRHSLETCLLPNFPRKSAFPVTVKHTGILRQEWCWESINALKQGRLKKRKELQAMLPRKTLLTGPFYPSPLEKNDYYFSISCGESHNLWNLVLTSTLWSQRET